MARTKMNGRFAIGGDTRTFPSVGMALVIAQGKAERADEPISFGVFEHDHKVARVERQENGVVITTSLNGRHS